MRKIISTAVVAIVVGAMAGATTGAMAQDAPASEQAIVPAVSYINAHKVDGKHAVGARASKAKRAGKLVATNKKGLLPANIIRPAWKLIQGKPAVLADDQVSWDELVGTAPKITLTTHSRSWSYTTAGFKYFDISCPAGKLTGGGFYDVNAPSSSGLVSSYPLNATTWRLTINVVNPNETGTGYVICMTGEPSTIVARLTPAARNPKSDR